MQPRVEKAHLQYNDSSRHHMPPTCMCNIATTTKIGKNINEKLNFNNIKQNDVCVAKDLVRPMQCPSNSIVTNRNAIYNTKDKCNILHTTKCITGGMHCMRACMFSCKGKIISRHTVVVAKAIFGLFL